jgi:hypothetical protein
MARRSLKPQLNQIRAWVRQGRTDAWIAHQLEVSATELREFRSQHDLTADEEDTSGEIDLRDEIEAEIEAATAEEEEAEEEEPEEETPSDGESDGDDDDGEGDGKEASSDDKDKAPRRARGTGRERQGGGGNRDGGQSGRAKQEGSGEDRPRRRRRRGRRGGRGRKRPEYEATFDHGERDGYGLWLDPSVKDNPVYTQHWSGKREVTVRIDPDQIVIRRPGAPAPPAESGDSDE